MARTYQAREIVTYYGTERGRPTKATASRVGHSVTLEAAVVAATKRITLAHFSSAVICDQFLTPLVHINVSPDHMSIIIKWLQE